MTEKMLSRFSAFIFSYPRNPGASLKAFPCRLSVRTSGHHGRTVANLEPLNGTLPITLTLSCQSWCLNSFHLYFSDVELLYAADGVVRPFNLHAAMGQALLRSSTSNVPSKLTKFLSMHRSSVNQAITVNVVQIICLSLQGASMNALSIYYVVETSQSLVLSIAAKPIELLSYLSKTQLRVHCGSALQKLRSIEKQLL